VKAGVSGREQQGRAEPVYIVGLDKGSSKRVEPVHSRAHVPVERYQRQKARKRIYVDSNTGPFKCPGCDIVTFSNRRSLDLHMKRVHKAGIVECDECGRKVLDLKRHKEILHKRFKIYECPHCTDKYCTQEDLERHLAKVEKNNMVGEKANAVSSASVEATAPDIPDEETFDSDAEDDDEPEPVVDTQEIVKKMEAKTFSCSECGLKTPSRMTYIQHVLNGCIMDMVLGENGGEGGVDSKTPVKRGRKPLDSVRKRPKVGTE
jgi:transcription elongation factor Elf1